MKITFKSSYCLMLAISFQVASCSGPSNKQPDIEEKQELPEKTDSLKLPPKDGTKTENDTTEHQ